jgi:hypothetical protein
VNFNLGIFNGYPKNNMSDNNDAKDFLGRVEFKPPIENASLTFGGFAWIGNAKPPTTYKGSPVPNPDEKVLEMNRFGGFAKLDYTANKVKVKFRGEFLMASTEELCDTIVDNACSFDGQTFFVHLGIQPSPKVEFLARYDFHDPDKDMSFEKKVASGTTKLSKAVNGNDVIMDDDEESWLTIGLNYYLEGINSMFYLNFIHKMEPGQKNVWDDEKLEYVTEDREFDNDQIVAQVQIVF